MLKAVGGSGNLALERIAAKRQAEQARATADALSAEAQQARATADAAEREADGMERDAFRAEDKASRDQATYDDLKRSFRGKAPSSNANTADAASRIAVNAATVFDRRGGVSFAGTTPVGQLLSIKA